MKTSTKEKEHKKTDIVFINPPLSHKERYGLKFKIGGQTPPTGLALLAAVCREHNYKVRIIDAPTSKLDYKSTIRRIIKLSPKYVGLTAVTLSIFNTMNVAKILKKHNPKIKLILGGAHITAAPFETIEKFGNVFDILCIGESEDTIIDLLDTLENNKPLENVNGIAYLNKEKYKFTEKREFIKDLDKLPMPAWDLLPNLARNYCPPAHTVKRFPAALVITSRGCPGQCTFCDNKVFGKTLRSHSADYVINMIEHLQKNYGIKEIQFRDDNFTVFKLRNQELFKKMGEKKIDIAWSCAARVDMITQETLALMKKAGCWQIWYGIESGSDKVLKAIKKNTTVEKIRKAIIMTKQAGISPCGFFMIGMPKETKEDIKKTIKLLLDLPLDEFHISHLAPFPGSEIYNTANQYGYFDNDWKKMSGWKTIFIPKDLTEEEIIKYSKKAMRKFYLRPRIIFQYLRRIRSFRHFKVYLSAFMAFIVLSILRKK
jgi:anaerobic magnesium-protoporphyrin IX monomethyl ester cyclase